MKPHLKRFDEIQPSFAAPFPTHAGWLGRATRTLLAREARKEISSASVARQWLQSVL
jgi:hypothetical protein